MMQQGTARSVLGNSLSAAAEVMTTDDAANVALLEFGVTGMARALAGERDSNFNVTDGSGREYLLKVAHSEEDPGIFEMQTQALVHAAKRDPELPIQRIVPTIEGAPQARVSGYGNKDRYARFVTYVQGTLQRKTTPTPAQRWDAGATLARLQLALSDFRHPAGAHATVWDLKNASRLRGLLGVVRDAERRRALTAVLDGFDERVAPALPRLRYQIVHNDLNSDNVVVSENNNDRVAGIIDFGDMVETAVVIDVAVAAAYQLAPTDTPLDGALDVLRGFTSRRSLNDLEVDLLFDLILTRMALRILVTESRAAEVPENSAYILRNTPTTWRQFSLLLGLPADAARLQIRNACRRGEA